MFVVLRQSQDLADMAVKLKKGQKASAFLPSPSPTSASGAAASSSTIIAFAAKLPKPPSTGNASLDTRLIAHGMNAQNVISSMQSERQLGSVWPLEPPAAQQHGGAATSGGGHWLG